MGLLTFSFRIFLPTCLSLHGITGNWMVAYYWPFSPTVPDVQKVLKYLINECRKRQGNLKFRLAINNCSLLLK